MTNFSDDTFHHLPAPSARLAFSPALDTSESTISPTFSNFSPSTSSGYSIPSPDSATVSTPSDADDAWNLIPYNVSWGHEYEEYRAGILPGPEGDCVFLRSPTPLRNQRASEACKKCRERKAKVRPSLRLTMVCAQKYASLFYQSVPELGLRVPVAPRAIISVNMHPSPHPIPPLQMPPLPLPPPRLVVPRAARPEKDQRY